MAKNDKLLIDGIIDERVALNIPSNKRDEAFEYLAFEQLFKNYDLTPDDIKSGNVDGRSDGGIDGIFVFVNGHLLKEIETFSWPKSGAELEIWIITCKHHDTFRQAPLDNLAASIVELFDFSLNNNDLQGEYSDRIKLWRDNIKYVYRKLAARLQRFEVNFCYASRGDASSVGDSILARAEQIKQISAESFANCAPNFVFIGSSELLELNRKVPKFSLELPFLKILSSGETYVLLARLTDYYDFIQDESKLRRYLFDSNVRDYMGLNRVNEDIKFTLANDKSPDFWWLNNGVTILATGANVVGDFIQIQNIQIVNGLQTSESIFRHFSVRKVDSDHRSVLVKVIVSKDAEVRDSIIRATNNQTAVELTALHATDKVQRDIEDILKLNDYYYERRPNFYVNQGVPLDKIIIPMYLASAYVNLVLKSPIAASRLRSRFIRYDSGYEKVFSEKTDINIWPKLVSIMKSTDEFLESVRPTRGSSERFLKGRRQIVSILAVAKIIGKFDFSVPDIISLPIESYNRELLIGLWEFLCTQEPDFGSGVALKNAVVMNAIVAFAKEFSVQKPERVERINENSAHRYGRDEIADGVLFVSLELAMRVNAALPKQPWKPGMHLEVSDSLNISKGKLAHVISFLVNEGYRYRQTDGVLYDVEGNIIDFDKDRVDPVTMKLKKGVE
jgi:hypothetical protein